MIGTFFDRTNSTAIDGKSRRSFSADKHPAVPDPNTTARDNANAMTKLDVNHRSHHAPRDGQHRGKHSKRLVATSQRHSIPTRKFLL
jgi:hypothetical protein